MSKPIINNQICKIKNLIPSYKMKIYQSLNYQKICFFYNKNKCIELNKTFVKYKTKLLYKRIIFNSFNDLGLILFKDGLLSYKNDLSKILSTLV